MIITEMELGAIMDNNMEVFHRFLYDNPFERILKITIEQNEKSNSNLFNCAKVTIEGIMHEKHVLMCIPYADARLNIKDIFTHNYKEHPIVIKELQ